jgi:hypothetical protein
MNYSTYSVDELSLLIQNAKIVFKVQQRNLNFTAAIETAKRIEEMRNALASR